MSHLRSIVNVAVAKPGTSKRYEQRVHRSDLLTIAAIGTIPRHMAWMWATSKTVCGASSLAHTMRRARFMLKSIAAYGSLKPMMEVATEAPLGILMRHRPETIGAVMWPYQCSRWDPPTRLDRIRDHYAVVEKFGGPINFSPLAQIELLDLHEIRTGFRVVLDQPKWFMREGQLTINLFLGETRLYSLAFSFQHHGNDIAAFIGAIQGRDIEGVLDQYRELTKASQGMRPRDLLIELFRMLCSVLGVTHIFAVSNKFRIRQSDYFGDLDAHKPSVNYDEIWIERGATQENPTCYLLPIQPLRRDLGATPAKKRGMYRRRYRMLDQIKTRMEKNYRRLLLGRGQT